MKTALLLSAFLGYGALEGAPIQLEIEQPVAPIRNTVETLHGVEVHDPYRYFENTDSAEVKAWAKGQSHYTQALFATLPLRNEIFQRFKEIDEERGADIKDITVGISGSRYFTKREPDESTRKLFKQDPDGVLSVLIDPVVLSGDKQPAAISHYKVSPNERYVACGISAGGSENARLFIFETETGNIVDWPIERVRWVGAMWLPDSSGFFYNQLQELSPEMSRQETFQRSKVWLHRIGETQDIPIFGIGLNSGIEVDSKFLPFVLTFPGCDWALAKVSTGVSANYAIYIAPIETVDDVNPPWTPVASMADEVGGFNGNDFAIHGDALFLLTRKNAPNGKIIRLDLKNPKINEATDVYSSSTGVIQDLVWAKDAIYLKVLEGGPSYLVRLPFNAINEPKKVPLPETGKVWMIKSDPRQEGVYFYFGTWSKPDLFYHYDLASNQTGDTGIIAASRPSICEELILEEVLVTSHDEEKIPLSIIYPKDIDRNGKNPVLLTGYGSYGISLQPYFKNDYVPLFEKGGILAVAHVRGGGEFGESWRLAGYQKNKPNTWKDFIACAEYLVSEKYTTPSRIFGLGRSAGGILIGRAITERPNLFGGAIIGVGVSDAVRMETTPNGVPNIPEFGTVKDKDQFHSLLQMSSYHHVEDGVEYPAILVAHGANDTRVELWQSLKIAARFQAATASEEPVLLRVDYKSGHGAGSGDEEHKLLWADMLAFLFTQSEKQ